MRRRHLLTLAGTSVTSLGGCLGGTEPTAPNRPEYDCGATARPEPGPLDTDETDAIGPATYPDRLDSLTDENAVEYVTAYERAYRQNSLVERYGARLVHVDLSIAETWTYETAGSSAVVRLQYRYSEKVERSDGTVVGDSPNVFASYYLDESVVRAERTGLREDESEFDPDPKAEGELLECFA